MQVFLRISVCIQSACTILKISMNVALVTPWMFSFLQHRWMESFLCWAHWNKYVADSRSLPFMRLTSHITFNSFFASQSGLFSIGWFCIMNFDNPSPLWDPFSIPHKRCFFINQTQHSEFASTVGEKNVILRRQKKTHLTHYTWNLFTFHTSALSSKPLPFPVPRIKS